MDHKRSQHSVYLLTYHAVFVVKDRRKVIDEKIMRDMKELTARLMKGYGGSLIEFNGEADYIHILFEIPPSKAPSKIVCSLKTQLSKDVREYHWYKFQDKLWRDSFWTENYFITTSNGTSMDAVKKYIEDQGKPKRKYKRRKSK